MPDNKLRILQFTDSFLPIMDGVGNVAYQYARCFAEKGHESYVGCAVVLLLPVAILFAFLLCH